MTAPADERALAAEDAWFFDLEPRVVVVAGYCLELAPELGYPPRVDHISGDDVERHRGFGGHPHLLVGVWSAEAGGFACTWVDVLPHELATHHRDFQRLAARRELLH